MTCPPECERTGMCVRACVPTAGPICAPCLSGDCDRCEPQVWDDTDKPTYCRCCGDPEF